MAHINLQSNEIQMKIVYYGPALSGKTTNLLYVYKYFSNRANSKLITINTDGDRTLFFDFFPFDLGSINGFNVRVQLFTVPGQDKYLTTRKLVINGVDGIVFVADMAVSQRINNILALKDLHTNLVGYNKSIFKIPMVFQFNKQDLVKNGIPTLSERILSKDLNRKLKKPCYIASALNGKNVAATLKKIIFMTSLNLINNLN
jgi:GTPase SAR1 family protein